MAAGDATLAWLPVPPERYGWTQVAAAHLLFALSFGAVYAFGVFFTPLQERFGVGRFPVALAFSLAACTYHLAGPVAGRLGDRFPVRRVVGAGAVLIGLGLGLASTAASPGELMVTYAVCLGLGLGLVYVPTMAVVQRWFVGLRTRACGLALAGIALGACAVPLVGAALAQALGWQVALRLLGLGIVVLGVLGAAVLVARPSDIGAGPDGLAAPFGAQDDAPGLTLSEAMATSCWRWLFAAILLTSAGWFTALAHIVPQGMGLGLTVPHAALLIGALGVGHVVGRLVAGGLADQLGAGRLLQWLALALVALHLVWLAAIHAWILAGFALLFGAVQGACTALYPALAAQWFGTRRLGRIVAALYVGVGLAGLFSAGTAGWLFDVAQSDALPVAVSALAALLGAACLRRAVVSCTFTFR